MVSSQGHVSADSIKHSGNVLPPLGQHHSNDVVRLVASCQGLDICEPFRTPKDGLPVQVEVITD